METNFMAQFPIVEENQVTDSNVQIVYDEIKAELGFGMVPNIFKSMATNPPFLRNSWNHFRSTVLQGKLPRTLKEMVGVVISQANNSEYAKQVHLHSLSAMGTSNDVLELMVSDFNNCPLPEREKAIISFGLKAATTPQNLTEKEYQKLEALGLDRTEIFEIISTANLFTGVNQYTDAISLEIDSL